MPEPVRVVIDPNVWISGLINPCGTPAKVIEAVIGRHVQAVVTPQLLDELATVLARPKLRRWTALADAVAFVDALGTEAEVDPDPGVVPRRGRDPGDDYLVALSEAAEAVIVTGDADLLEADLTLPAVTPHQLLDCLGWT